MHNLTKIKVYRLLLRISYLLSWIFVYPFVLLRKKSSSPLFFFFDRYAIGGAQRIYLDVLKSVEDIPKQIYFTRFSLNDKLKNEFYSIPRATVKDIHRWCDNLLFRLFTVHYYAFYINRHAIAHVFSSNSTFFFDMLPFLHRNVQTTELFHNFAHNKNGLEFFGLANHGYLTNRVIYDNYTLSNITRQYEEYGVDPAYLNNIRFIEPGVFIPGSINKDFSLPLKVLYAGRGGPQKRVWILNQVIEKLTDENVPVKFYFAGTMTADLSDFSKQQATVYGGISSQKDMYAIYEESHVLILTSAYEGFPMVIKEAMACGCVPVVTALEGNKMHLTHDRNALLIESIEEEDKVAEEAITIIHRLVHYPDELRRLSVAAYEYARDHFTKQPFFEKCRALLLTTTPPRDQINI